MTPEHLLHTYPGGPTCTSQHVAVGTPAPTPIPNPPSCPAGLQQGLLQADFRQVLLSLELLPSSPWRGLWVGHVSRVGRGTQGCSSIPVVAGGGSGSPLSGWEGAGEGAVPQTPAVEEMSIIFNNFAAAFTTSGVSGPGPGVGERRSSAVTTEELMVVALNARAPPVPSSLPAFSFPVTANLWSGAGGSCAGAENVSSVSSAEGAQRSCKALSCLETVLRGASLCGCPPALLVAPLDEVTRVVQPRFQPRDD